MLEVHAGLHSSIPRTACCPLTPPWGIGTEALKPAPLPAAAGAAGLLPSLPASAAGAWCAPGAAPPPGRLQRQGQAWGRVGA